MSKELDAKGYPFYPRELLRQLGVAILVVGLVLSLAVLLPVGYHEEASYLSTPLGVKAEWYFLWLYQLMKLVPEGVGLGIAVLFVVGALGVPFLDRAPSGRLRDRRWIVIVATVAIVGIVVLTLLGALPGEG